MGSSCNLLLQRSWIKARFYASRSLLSTIHRSFLSSGIIYWFIQIYILKALWSERDVSKESICFIQSHQASFHFHNIISLLAVYCPFLQEYWLSWKWFHPFTFRYWLSRFRVEILVFMSMCTNVGRAYLFYAFSIMVKIHVSLSLALILFGTWRDIINMLQFLYGVFIITMVVYSFS